MSDEAKQGQIADRKLLEFLVCPRHAGTAGL